MCVKKIKTLETKKKDIYIKKQFSQNLALLKHFDTIFILISDDDKHILKEKHWNNIIIIKSKH